MRMAEGPRSGQMDADERIDLRPLLRVGAWGMAATLALGLATLAARTDVGERRVTAALAPTNAMTDQTRIAMAQLAARTGEAEREARRLGEQVLALTSDRDHLAGRLSQLERNFEDLTGSIALTQPARRPAGAAPAATSPAREDAAPPAAESQVSSQVSSQTPAPRVEIRPAPEARDAASAAPTASVEPAAATPGEDVPAEIPLPRPNPLFLAQALANATASRVATAVASGEMPVEAPVRSRIGVDLGGATSVEGLRAIWARVKESHPPLADLRPVIAVRESTRSGAVELRLVAGPVVNQGAAARLCAALAAASIPCRSATYDGQRLAVP